MMAPRKPPEEESPAARRHRRANDPPEEVAPLREHSRATDHDWVARVQRPAVVVAAVGALVAAFTSLFIGLGGLYSLPGARTTRLEQRVDRLDARLDSSDAAYTRALTQLVDSMETRLAPTQEQVRLLFITRCATDGDDPAVPRRMRAACDSLAEGFYPGGVRAIP
jgi:hypothetical protein